MRRATLWTVKPHLRQPKGRQDRIRICLTPAKLSPSTPHKTATSLAACRALSQALLMFTDLLICTHTAARPNSWDAPMTRSHRWPCQTRIRQRSATAPVLRLSYPDLQTSPASPTSCDQGSRVARPSAHKRRDTLVSAAVPLVIGATTQATWSGDYPHPDLQGKCPCQVMRQTGPMAVMYTRLPILPPNLPSITQKATVCIRGVTFAAPWTLPALTALTV